MFLFSRADEGGWRAQFWEVAEGTKRWSEKGKHVSTQSEVFAG